MSAMTVRLLQQRMNTWEGLKATLDKADGESRDLTVEEQTDYDARTVDLDRLDQRVRELTDAEARAEQTAATLAALDARPAERAVPGAGDQLRSFLSGQGDNTLTVRADRPIGTTEFRALSKLTAAAGANTVKVSFYDRLIAHMIEVSGLLQAGPTVLNTTSGEQIQVPKTTAHSTAALTAEGSAIPVSDPAFGQIALDAYKYGILLQVSSELIADTSVDLEGYLAMQAGRAVGNALGSDLVVGTGSNQPQGIAPVATVGVTGGTAVVGAFNADNLIDLQYSVIAPYRRSASCAWLLRDATLATLRKLKDNYGRYLWEPSVQVGVPDTLLGKPIIIDPFVAAVALNARSVLFGDISQYYLRLVNGVRFERSVDFAFNTDLVTYRILLRGDGDLVDRTGAVKAFVGGAS